MGNKSNTLSTDNKSIPNVILNIEETPVNKKFLKELSDHVVEKYSKNVFYCKDLKSFEIHIQKNPDEKIFLITSGASGLDMNKKGIFSSRNYPIENVFIYCRDVEGHKQWCRNINKIALISDDHIEIFKKVDEKYLEKLLESKIPEYEKSIPNYSIDNSEIIKLLSSLFLLGMFENEKANYDKLIREAEEDFIKYCRDYHSVFGVNEDESNRLILDVENGRFSGGNVIDWFTKGNSLLFKIVDFNLTNLDIVESFKIRVALYKISQALKGYQLTPNSINYVYKASIISDCELLLLIKYSNSKDYLHMRGYTLAAMKEDLVKPNKNKPSDDSQLKSVVYKIGIKSLQNLVYDLKDFNLKDVLLLDNKAFLNVLKVEEKADKRDFDFIVHCELVHFEDVLSKLNPHLSPIPKIDAGFKSKNFTNGDFYLWESLLIMKEYDKLLEILSKNEIENKYLDDYTYYYYIGRAHNQKRDYKKALEFYHKSLEIIYKQNKIEELTDKNTLSLNSFQEPCNYCDELENTYNVNILFVKSIPDVYPDLPTLYYFIGNVNYNNEEYSKAIEHYKIVKIIMPEDSYRNPIFHNLDNLIGQSYKNKGKYDVALSSFNSFLNSSYKLSSPEDIKIGIAHNNIGSINLILSNYYVALKSFEDGLAAFGKKNLPENHPYRALTYSNIGMAYEKLKKSKEAIENYEKCLEIRLKYLSNDHREITCLQEKIMNMKQNSNS